MCTVLCGCIVLEYNMYVPWFWVCREMNSGFRGPSSEDPLTQKLISVKSGRDFPVKLHPLLTPSEMMYFGHSSACSSCMCLGSEQIRLQQLIKVLTNSFVQLYFQMQGTLGKKRLCLIKTLRWTTVFAGHRTYQKYRFSFELASISGFLPQLHSMYSMLWNTQIKPLTATPRGRKVDVYSYIFHNTFLCTTDLLRY